MKQGSKGQGRKGQGSKARGAPRTWVDRGEQSVGARHLPDEQRGSPTCPVVRRAGGAQRPEDEKAAREIVRREERRASGPPGDQIVAGCLTRLWHMADPAVTSLTVLGQTGEGNRELRSTVSSSVAHRHGVSHGRRPGQPRLASAYAWARRSVTVGEPSSRLRRLRADPSREAVGQRTWRSCRS